MFVPLWVIGCAAAGALALWLLHALAKGDQ